MAPAFAAHAPSAHANGHSGAATAAALVEKLRELPLPIRAFPQGIAPTKATPLPDLESRRQQVYDELHALGPASVPALARALHDPNPEMRRHVAVALDVVGGGWWQFPDGGAKLDLRPALPALLTALRDSDPDVRAWAAQDIGDIGGGGGNGSAAPARHVAQSGSGVARQRLQRPGRDRIRGARRAAGSATHSQRCEPGGPTGRARRDHQHRPRHRVALIDPNLERRCWREVSPGNTQLSHRLCVACEARLRYLMR